eukprot:5791_1
MTSLSLLYLALQILHAQLICEDGYTCWEDSTRNIVWVKKDEGNIYGPSCRDVCEEALLNNNVYHACDHEQPIFYNMNSFSDIATGLGFTCKKGGCWNSSAPGSGLIAVKRGDDTDKTCYFPNRIDTTFSCSNTPGNANCFGERYSIICPCIEKPLEEACIWSDNKANIPQIATWGNTEQGTSCIDRINYWRKRACEEQWIECPPAGLPPMTECTCCHNCANSQAEYDKNNGAHKSFKRCGDMVQGEGGGATCANVIDAFVSERAEDENGVVRCQGHCGPIVSHGCQTFFWGEYNGFHTLNWRTCNAEKCAEYCSDPSDNACFSSSSDIQPNTGNCSDSAMNDDGIGAVTIVFIVVFATLFVAGIFALLWKKFVIDKRNNDSKTNKKKNKDKKSKGKGKTKGKKGETNC